MLNCKLVPSKSTKPPSVVPPNNNSPEVWFPLFIEVSLLKLIFPVDIFTVINSVPELFCKPKKLEVVSFLFTKKTSFPGDELILIPPALFTDVVA